MKKEGHTEEEAPSTNRIGMGTLTTHMIVLSGKEPAKRIREELKETIENENLSPGLAVLLVGGDAASALYVGLKEKAAAEVGVRMTVARVASCSTKDAVERIEAWNADPSIHGIIVQLPLPAGMDADAVVQTITPNKDVDGFHPETRGAVSAGTGETFSPVHLAVLTLVGQSGLNLNGTEALILGKSPIFTEPLAHLLKRAGAFVRVEQAKPRPYALKEARLVVTALGQAGLLEGPELHPDAVVIDISTNRRADGKTVGDVVADTLGPTQAASPVPGGVGPLTIAFLLKNTVEEAQRMR